MSYCPGTNQPDSVLVTDVRPKLLFASLYLRGYIFSKFKETNSCQMVQQHLRLGEILQHLNTTQSSGNMSGGLSG